MMKKKDIISTLKQGGNKITKARVAIVEMLVSEKIPLTVVEIVSRLKVMHVPVDKTTVYREIAFLLEQNILHEVQFGDRKKRYEFASLDHHHHVICIRCQKVTDIYLENELDVQERAITEQTGFTLVRHSLEFFGICPSCKKQEQKLL